MALIFLVVSYAVPCFGFVTKTVLLTCCAQQCLHTTKAFSAPHSDTQWRAGCGQGAGGGTAGAADLRDSLCCMRSCSLIKSGDGEGGCCRGLLFGDCQSTGSDCFFLACFSWFGFDFFPFYLLNCLLLNQQIFSLLLSFLWGRVWGHFSIC